MTPKLKSLAFYGIASGVTVLDQVTKALARAYLNDGKSVTVIPGFFDLQLSYNDGAAFGIMPNWAPLFIIFALVAIYAIVKLRGPRAQYKSLSAGLALLMGGALGNMIDRITPPYAVTDFLSFFVQLGGITRAWPTFNIADSAIVIGALLVFFHVYIVEKRNADAGITG